MAPDFAPQTASGLLTFIMFLGIWHCAVISIAAGSRLLGRARWCLSAAFAGLGYVQAVLAILCTESAATLPYWIPLLAVSVGMSVAPALYLGIRSLLDPKRQWRGKDGWHFVPAAIQLCIQLPLMFAGPMRGAFLERYTAIGLVDSFIPGAEVPRLIFLVYLALTVRAVLVYRRRQTKPDADGSPRPRPRLAYTLAATYGALCPAMVLVFTADTYAWVRPVIISGVIGLLILGVLVCPALLHLRSDEKHRASQKRSAWPEAAGDGSVPHAAPEAVALEASRAPSAQLAAERGATAIEEAASTKTQSSHRAPDDDASSLQSAGAARESAAKYEHSPLTPERSERYAQRLRALMETEKPYLDPDLTLGEMGEQLDLLPRYVSQVVNEEVGQSFTAFVNAYRVKAAKQLLLDEAHQHLTVVAVAHKAGFNSKSAFYAAFKKDTGTTPAAFRDARHSAEDAPGKGSGSACKQRAIACASPQAVAS